jgi:ABC-type multidrug transport system ATPase subunit
MQITIRNLNKVYPGDVYALRDVSLDISEGMFGLLGPNGAGKTTLMKILATLEQPTSGEVLVDGENISVRRREVRSTLGYLPQFFGAYPQMTGSEFLRYIGRLCGFSGKALKESVEENLIRVGLFEVRDRKVKTYSGGMLRRLGVAQALVGNPRLLIIDEPTTGLDPEERIRFRNLLSVLSRDKVIILSTHIVGDISSTCENIALLSHGRLVFRGQPESLVDQASGKVWQAACNEEDFGIISEHMNVISTIPVEGRLLLRLVGKPVDGFEMQNVPPNLEDAYMHFMENVVGEHVEEEAGVMED